MIQPVLTTHALSKSYGSRRAVDGLHLEVRAGEVLGFLGPNGAGKTTTIRMALGLIRPTAGHVRILGEDVATARARVLPRVGALIEAPVVPLASVDAAHVLAVVGAWAAAFLVLQLALIRRRDVLE